MKVIRALALLCVVGLPFGATSVCNYSYFGMDSCTTSWCGYGCNPTSIGPTYYACYTGSTGCCACAYYYYSCACTFGSGSGRVCGRGEYTGATCGSDGYCYNGVGKKIMMVLPAPPETA